jgi:peptidoglycan/xylan/chitin deacetylase (PgdA/CDA1 family)
MVSICFRFDDASAKSDHKLEHKVFDVFARLNVPLCVAVIPFAGAGEPVPLSPQNAAHLFDAARAGVIEIALHGHSHRHRGNDARGRRTEFFGLHPAEQTRLIREGMQHLASAFNHRIQGFVPPWNTYDASTTQALAEAGFEFLSAGFDVFRHGRLPVVPITCRLRTARIAIQKACCFEWLAPVVVVLFHSDDFMEYRYPPRHDESWPAMNLRELEALLEWIKTKPGLHAEALSHIARCSANGTNLRSSSELTLPYRVKVLVPRMLVRSAAWRTLPGILWGMFRSRSGFDAEIQAEPVVLGAHDGKHF